MKFQQKLIIIFLLVSLIPMFIISNLFFAKARTSLEKDRLVELESIADLKVNTLNKIVANLKTDAQIAQDYLNIKTNLPVLIRFADDSTNPAFIEATKKLDSQFVSYKKIKHLINFILVSPKGTVLYMANKTQAKMNIGQPLFAKVPLEDGKKGIYFSPIFKVRGSENNFEILVTAPVYTLGGLYIGTLVFEVNMNPIYRLMQKRTGLGNTGETLIGKNMGDHALFLNPTIYDPDATLKRKAMFGSPNAYPLQEAVQGRNNGGISFDYRGEKILAVWRYIPSMKWGLVAKLDSSEAFAPITELKNIFLMIVGIFLLVLVFSAISISRSLSRPIQALKEGIEIIGKGNLEHKVGVDRKDEIGELSQAFDEMIENLKLATASRDELEAEMAERTQAEQSLRESEARTHAIVDKLVDGLITIDETGTVDSFNPAAERIFGYNADEVIGNNVNMLMPQPHHGQHDGYLKHYMDTGEAKVIGIDRTVEGKRKDGSTFPLDLAVNEMRLGDKRTFIGAVRDITERVAAEQAIAESNQELALRGRYDQSYAKIMALFSSTFDQDKALSGLLSILAGHHPFPVSAIYTYDEWSGTLVLTASHGAPDTLKKEFERGEGLLGQTALEGKTMVLEEFGEAGLSIETGVLSFAPACVPISPIMYQDKTVGVLALAASTTLTDQDMPFLDRMAAQLGVAMNNLRQHRDLMDVTEQLRQRGEEITQQNQQLEQASRMKSEFLANMSHELRTPLNAIIGFSEVLKDGVMGEMNREQTEYVGDIFNSGQHLLSLINDILDLSKIEAGKMELDLEEINVSDLLNNSLSIIKERAMTHRIRLSLDISDGVEACWMDGRKAKQIVFNLLSNAVKFTTDGGSVSIKAHKVQGEAIGHGKDTPSPLSEIISNEGEFIEITVSDTGIGISEADQKKLFNAFVQADSSLSRKFEGTGLGLVMVKRLAELHGGTVGMQSEQGKGSTFTVWLPYRTAAASRIATAPAEPRNDKDIAQVVRDSRPEHPAKLSVLIVEDDDSAANLMRLQLETEGYRTVRAASAEEALEMLTETKPDLITLDILMPGIDGWDFLGLLKKDKTLAHIPVVIVSIMADEKKGFSLGATEVLQKPVSKKLLLASVVDAGFGLNGGVSGTVLVVDDDPKAVELVCRHLESSGATTLRAYGGAEAIDLAAEKHPDLIVLDLMMPEVTGFDVVDALKAYKGTANIPIIILTAKVITDTDRKALNGGILKIVEKSSFNHSSFINEVRRASTGPRGKSKTAPFFPDPVEPRKSTVLVVEDNARESNLLKHYLEESGYAVMQAGSGAIALETIREHKPDLITLDMMMPDMDGLEFLNEKANLPKCLDVPVLIVSGVDDASKGLSLGANAIVRKPIKKREFLDIVDSLDINQSAEAKLDILVVDDDPKAVKIISSYFDAGACRIIKAYGGEEAMHAVNQTIPNLIVLDLMMPDVDGFEVIHRLKQDKKTHNIPIIVLTAKILTRDERQKLMRQVQAIEEKGSFSRDQFLTEVAALTKEVKS